jgi:hypothetical protein
VILTNKRQINRRKSIWFLLVFTCTEVHRKEVMLKNVLRQGLIYYYYYYFAVLLLELRAYTLSHSTNPFCVRCFWDRVSRTICPGWLWTVILLISASWVARITGVSHQCLAVLLCSFNKGYRTWP